MWDAKVDWFETECRRLLEVRSRHHRQTPVTVVKGHFQYPQCHGKCFCNVNLVSHVCSSVPIKKKQYVGSRGG